MIPPRSSLVQHSHAGESLGVKNFFCSPDDPQYSQDQVVCSLFRNLKLNEEDTEQTKTLLSRSLYVEDQDFALKAEVKSILAVFGGHLQKKEGLEAIHSLVERNLSSLYQKNPELDRLIEKELSSCEIKEMLLLERSLVKMKKHLQQEESLVLLQTLTKEIREYKSKNKNKNDSLESVEKIKVAALELFSKKKYKLAIAEMEFLPLKERAFLLSQIWQPLFSQGKGKLAYKCAHSLLHGKVKTSLNLHRLATKMIHRGYCQLALEIARSGSEEEQKEILTSLLLFLLKKEKKGTAVDIASTLLPSEIGWSILAQEHEEQLVACICAFSPSEKRDQALSHICRAIFDNGYTAKALKLIEEIDSLEEKSSALQYIALEIGYKGLADEALGLTFKMHHPLTRFSTLKQLAELLLRQNLAQQAFSTIHLAPFLCQNEKDAFLKIKAAEFFAKGKLNQALKWANSIGDQLMKEASLWEIALGLDYKKHWQDSLKIIEPLSQSYKRQIIYKNILHYFYSLREREVLTYIETFLAMPVRSYFLKKMSAYFLSQGKSDLALKFACHIEEEDSKSLAFKAIARDCLYRKDEEKAKEILSLIANKRMRHSLKKELKISQKGVKQMSLFKFRKEKSAASSMKER